MELSKIKLTEIKPAEYNPRRISAEDFNKLKNSIKTFGLTDPIIINLKNNNIIGGHQRYDVLVDILLEEDNLAEKEYDLIKKGDIGFIFDVDNLVIKNDDYEKGLNIALNKISGEWDLVKLNDLVEDLKIKNFDLSLTGFDEIELDELALENDDFFNDEVADVDEEIYELEEDLSYTLRFKNKYDEEKFHNLIDELNDGNDISTNILNYLEKYISDNPQKYSAEYELTLKDDNEKDRLHNLLYKIEERYNNESADLMELIREIWWVVFYVMG